MQMQSVTQELPAPKLDFLWLELTNRCNLSCSHCYSSSSPYSGDTDVLTEADYVRLIREGRDLGCRQIQFIGGEPTLNKSLPKLIEEASKAEYHDIEVFTNLVSLSDSLRQTFLSWGVSVATSFYSSRSFTHDLITKSVGSFDRTVKNISKILADGIPLRVGIIEMEANQGHYDETVAFLRSLGVTNIGVDSVRDFGRAQAKTDCSMGDLCGQCANNVLAVGPDGVISPCIMSKAWAVGSALGGSLSEIATSQQLFEIRQQIADATQIQAMGDCQPTCGPNRQQCVPECGPSKQCSPCGPNASQKCYPNNNCSPGKCSPGW